MRIAVFASGNGTDLQSIIDATVNGKLSAEIGLVISNNQNSGALQRARNHGILDVYLSSKDFDSRDKFVGALINILECNRIDFIALAGYLRKVPPEIVGKFKNRIVNIHPALLPSFCGKNMYGMRVHREVIEYGCKVTGVTIHLVDNDYDRGPIVAQRCVPVLDDDTPETLAERVLTVEHKLYPEVLQWFADDRIFIDDKKVKIISI
ncbi:phosphoribosylglycinamide formyltransferase [bacterium]|nr:phosphoribosylglycinamide formyltransferase [bacterium]